MATKLDKKERTWAAFCHLGGFGMFVIPLVGNILAPLILWMMKREESKFVDQQGKEAVNFQITVSIVGAAAGLLCLIYVGIPIALAILVYDVALMTMASVRAHEGEAFAYPLSFRFLQREIPWLTSAPKDDASGKEAPEKTAEAKPGKAPASSSEARPEEKKPEKGKEEPAKAAKKASSKKGGKKSSKKKSSKKKSSKKKSGKKKSGKKKSRKKSGGKSSVKKSP